jgi:hypothetical protein
MRVHQHVVGLLTLSFFLLIPVTEAFAWQDRQVSSVIMNGSKLKINGTSNITDFECIYDEEIENDTLTHYVDVEEAFVEVGGDDLRLEIDSFDCGKNGINRDFRKALRSDEYPNIDIRLVKVIRTEGEPVEADVAISLAGATNQYTVALQDVSVDGEAAIIGGTQIINMTDFGIAPPTALFGLIKVDNTLEINFTLRIKQ